jgi:predicted NAD-dependent protein-ADP-ribosyltransferase YbiA (DUF1768 family)
MQRACGCADRPREAFDYPRNPQNKPYVREDWHLGHPPVKYQIMRRGVLEKFRQDGNLCALLLGTHREMPRLRVRVEIMGSVMIRTD